LSFDLDEYPKLLHALKSHNNVAVSELVLAKIGEGETRGMGRGEGHAGWHWSFKKDVAQRFARDQSSGDMVINYTYSEVGVLLEATYNSSDVETDPDRLIDGAVSGYAWDGPEEHELSLRDGAPLNLSSASLYVPEDIDWALTVFEGDSDGLYIPGHWVTIPMSSKTVTASSPLISYYGEEHGTRDAWRGFPLEVSPSLAVKAYRGQLTVEDVIGAADVNLGAWWAEGRELAESFAGQSYDSYQEYEAIEDDLGGHTISVLLHGTLESYLVQDNPSAFPGEYFELDPGTPVHLIEIFYMAGDHYDWVHIPVNRQATASWGNSQEGGWRIKQPEPANWAGYPYFSGSAFEPVPFLAAGKQGYKDAHPDLGILGNFNIDYSKVAADSVTGKEIADLYRAAPIYDPAAQPAYDQLIKETAMQYEYLTKVLGVKVEVSSTDPYRNVSELIHDITVNHHQFTLSTATTGHKLMLPIGRPIMTDEENDRFRAVHDAFGHAASGRAFDRNGEAAAWVAHMQMFSPLAGRALTTETHARNSVLIYGTPDQKTGPAFAAQKVFLLPTKYSDTDIVRTDVKKFLGQTSAAWVDVQAKAKRIYDEGGVRIISVTGPYVTAHVEGDHGVYETTLQRGSNHEVLQWTCSCPWFAYSFGRSGRWKRYEARECGHALALQYKAQSEGIFDREIKEEEQAPEWDKGDVTYYTAPPPKPWKVGQKLGMATSEAEEMAHSLMDRWLDRSWTFKWNRQTRAFGETNYRDRIISLSKPLCEVNSTEEIRDTILHEIAHALAGPGSGHGPEWKMWATKVGARPEAQSGEDTVSAPPKVIGVCPNCGAESYRQRMPRDVTMWACANPACKAAVPFEQRTFQWSRVPKIGSKQAKVFYHGTSLPNAESIYEYQSFRYPNVTTLTTNFDMARGYSVSGGGNDHVVLKITVPDDQLNHWVYESAPGVGGWSWKRVFDIPREWMEILDPSGNPIRKASSALNNSVVPLYSVANPLPGEGLARQYALAPSDADFMGAEIAVLSKEYRDLPILDRAAVGLWTQLGEIVNEQARNLRKTWDIQVLDTDPYATAAEMHADLAQRVYKVTTLHSHHPVWDVDTNVNFRITHDINGHGRANSDFSFHGEVEAFQAQCDTIPEDLWEVLFTEVVAQSAYANVHHLFGEQKVGLINLSPEEMFALVGQVADAPDPQYDALHFSARYLTIDEARAGKIDHTLTASDTNDHVDTHSGTMVAVRPPDSMCKAMTIDSEDAEGYEQLHVTLAYIPAESNVDLDLLRQVVQNEAALSAPIPAHYSGYGQFDNPESVVTVALVDSAELQLARQYLVDALERAGIEISHDHGFVPHTTITYGDVDFEGLTPLDLSTFTFGEFIISPPSGKWERYPFPATAHSATLHDEPEGALPSTDGAEDDETEPGNPTLSWLMTNKSTEGVDMDIAKAATNYLMTSTAVKDFTYAEQQEIISEGEGTVTARNLDRLDLSGTHYQQLEAQLAQAEAADDSVFWWD
jgi:predicted SprT family Zn-dependent metalloprotease